MKEGVEGNEAVAWDRTKILSLLLKSTGFARDIRPIGHVSESNLNLILENARQLGLKRKELSVKAEAIELMLERARQTALDESLPPFVESLKAIVAISKSANDLPFNNHTVRKLLELGKGREKEKPLQIEILKSIEILAKG